MLTQMSVRPETEQQKQDQQTEDMLGLSFLQIRQSYVLQILLSNVIGMSCFGVADLKTLVELDPSRFHSHIHQARQD